MASITKSAGTCSDDATLGTITWTNPDNATISDDIYAVASNIPYAENSHYLNATNFGFSIPPGSILNGMVVEVEGKDTVSSHLNYKMIIGGAKGTLGAMPPFSTSDSYVSIGSSVTYNLDITKPTISQINASNFGIALYTNGIADVHTVSIDHIRITVYYTEVFPTLTGISSITGISSLTL